MENYSNEGKVSEGLTRVGGETRLLALCFLYPELIDEMMGIVREEHFLMPLNCKLFRYMEEAYLENRKFSRGRAIMDLRLDEDYFDYKYLSKFEFPALLEEVVDEYARRQIKQAAREIQDLTERPGSAEDYNSRALEVIYKYTADETDMMELLELETPLEESIQALVPEDSDMDLPGVGTGYPSIDATCGNLLPGHLTVIAAQTSAGKTSFALNMAYNMINAGRKVLFISLEMKAREVTDKLLIMDSRIGATRYRRKVSAENLGKVEGAAARLKGLPLYISEKRGLDIAGIRAQIMKAQRRYGLDVVMIDYLQLIELSGKYNQNKAETVSEGIKGLRNLAGELDLPVVLISQLNRKADNYKRPEMQHLKDSSAIEQMADEVWLIYRPDQQKEMLTQQKIYCQKAELIMAKGRTKGASYVALDWYPEEQLFKDPIS